MVDDAVLRGEALRLVFGGKTVLSNVDVFATHGEVLGVVGPNGAGKTTLLRVLAGDLALLSGHVWLAGEEVTALPLWERARRGLGYVPQSASVLPDLSVGDNLRTFEAAARVRPRPPEEWIRRFGLEGKLTVRAGDLSGGERRRLELLRAAVGGPRVLICDEPFAAGDPEHIRLVSAHLRSVAEAGGTVIIADHRLSDALAVCSRAMLLVDGAVEAVAVASRFEDHPAVRGLYRDRAANRVLQ